MNEGSIIEVSQPNKTLSTKLHIIDSPRGPIKIGANNKQRVITQLVSKDGNKHGPLLNMVRREVGQEGMTADTFFNYWKSLVKAQIPTYSFVRVINPKEVLVPDLSADGTTFFGKDSMIDAFHRYENSQLTSIDSFFLNIKTDDIEIRLREIVNKANKENIRLPKDDPFHLMVHPNGSWEITTIDLVPPTEEINIQQFNSQLIKQFMLDIETNRQALKGTKPDSIIDID